MTAIEKALARSRSVVNSAQERALQLKDVSAVSGQLTGGMNLGSFGPGPEFGANRLRYSQFRGWLYAAIDSLSREAAGQPVHMARVTNAEPNREQRSFTSYKAQTMPKGMRSKLHGEQETEIILSHPLLDAIDNPNPIQHRWQFVYSFVANLNLTGWAYIVGGETDEGDMEFYSVPTTWVRPDHSEGPFSKFRIVDPKKPASQDNPPLGRENVAFAHLPNPSDPMSALAPAASQMMAIRVDDHIQTSQDQFFNNGVFPSVIVSIGKDPHPDVPGGVRPRLTGTQRRQVTGAIRKVMGGVANYGNPAIVDGLIEKIERLSHSQTEMGWDKSEDKVRDRILSAFGVHPFIFGMDLNVGGYAQAAKIEERFCKRVNTFLEFLSNVMTNFAGPMTEEDERTLVWWEQCTPHDPELFWKNMREGRKNSDVSRNEYRAALGLPPVEEERSKVLDNVQVIGAVTKLLAEVGKGTISRSSAAQFLITTLQLPKEDAEAIVQGGEEQVLEETLSTMQQVLKRMDQPVTVSGLLG